MQPSLCEEKSSLKNEKNLSSDVQLRLEKGRYTMNKQYFSNLPSALNEAAQHPQTPFATPKEKAAVKESLATLKRRLHDVNGLSEASPDSNVVRKEADLPANNVLSPEGDYLSDKAKAALQLLHKVTCPLIDDLYNSCDREFDPTESGALSEERDPNTDPGPILTFGEIAGNDIDWRVKTFDLIVNSSNTSYSDGHFTWTSREEYAPKLVFSLDGNTIPRYDECGKVINPAKPYDCPELGDLLEVDFNASSVTILNGKSFTLTDSMPIFELENPATPSKYILVVAKWGGAHCKARGRTATEVAQWQHLQIEHFEKVASKRGGEGCDYYVLPVNQSDPLVGELKLYLAKLGLDRLHKVARGMREYDEKKMILDRIDERVHSLRDQVHECEEYYEQLRHDCSAMMKGKPQYDIVHLPTFDWPEFGKFDPESCKRNSSPDMLRHQCYNLYLESKQLASYQTRAAVHAKAWMSFAPRYAALQAKVIALFGWLVVHEDHASIVLPARDRKPTEDDSLVMKMDFGFSEGQLRSCLDFLQNHEKAEMTDMVENSRALASLDEMAKPTNPKDADE